ncbi:GNAT family N-acetyltransferase [Vulcaniibacterium tengchongense]|uniref:Putative acetyltransferase n=1 Tax=Vulcaniibacterium tengchongense TaxID=1273429 RepID=A0A3N4VB97_9GAMM|nr:putative acetyltransferase [Vulcaniibacterium tengchongense]
MSLPIRAERPGEADAIATLIGRAFALAPYSSGTEAAIVAGLRRAGALSLSLVAEDEGAIAGYLAASAVVVSGGAGGWHGLGPIAVAPERQRRGIGARLVERALASLRECGAAGCVVLGEPDYYGRFGFRADPDLVLPGVPARYFQAIRFAATGCAGTVAYHPAFDASA